ncbi:response regulator [Pelagicoccus sp. NFK12]|uniref:histidine kinase n=1 Tax=Pelagicoccus enzymogenes TaxID=2773457 RepID=A0A927F795_9BACT|nr:PAS domain-containing hybrid sensor histidine kinase/response regulator [Pelagicoccus enzymogenes]MBD5779664.1 response regulator [Pelagicoccus enzymogenes]
MNRDRSRFLLAAASGVLAGAVVLLVRPEVDWTSVFLPLFVSLIALLASSFKDASSNLSSSPAGNLSNPYQVAFSAAGVAGLLWNLKLDEIRCDNVVFKILGFEHEGETISAERFRQALHLEDRAAFKLAFEHAKSGRRRSPMDCRFVKPGGGVVWVELTLCPVLDEQGHLQIAGAITEVTERKRTESLLDRGVAYMEAILENTKNIVFSIDADYRLTVFNSRFRANMRAAFGKRIHAGDSVFEISPSDIAPTWKPRFARALAGESFQIEEGFNIKGSRFYFHISLRPIRESGRVVGATVYSRNITQQKLREREWVEAKEKAEESDRLKSAFLANMSHEIRTPLNAVMGFAQLLKTGEGTEAEREKFLDIILSNGDHLLRILGDIIELAQIESNQLRVEPVMFDLHMMLTETYSAFHDRIQGADGSSVELVMDNQLQGTEFVLCDETRLKQIVYNLISNSIKFTAEGSIHVGYDRGEEGMLEFYVADTGSGVPESMRERIFKRFRQGESQAGKRNDGVGLGLSICQGLVSLLGGRIWIEANHPHGAVFRFTIRDLSHGAGNGDVSAGKSNVHGNSDQSLQRKIQEGSKVLVAEDDDMNFQVVDEILRKEKLVSIRAVNGEDAVSAVERDLEIKLVVMDISMPVLNGLEATRLIKQRRPDLPVIAHTAHAMQSDLDRALQAGCSDCLVKPINIERFKQLIARYV